MMNDNETYSSEPFSPSGVPESPTPQTPLFGASQGPEKKKKKHTGLRTVALCLVCALLGGAGGVAAVRYLPGLGSGEATAIYQSSRAPVSVDTVQVDGRTSLSVAEVYKANLASVVGVNGNVKTNYWGQVVSSPVAGSGFVITQDGYILTCYHVIDGVEDLKVFFADGTSYDAVLVGGEEANDIAVLKIDADGLQPVVVGDSDQMEVGQQVAAVGNPLGELTFTLTAGYVSALDRLITMSDGTAINVMQTDAAINSGNSGGPLFNLYGECVGITNAKYSNNGSSDASIEGIGFAIPINDVIDMVSDIIEKGYVSGKPSVGILMDDVDESATRRYGVPQGAYIQAVLPNSCAAKAGIQEGDIVTAVAGETVESSAQLQEAVRTHKAGETVTFTLYRDGESVDVTLVLDENTPQRAQEMTEFQQSQAQQSQTQPSNPSQGSGESTWPFSFWPFGGFNW